MFDPVQAPIPQKRAPGSLLAVAILAAVLAAFFAPALMGSNQFLFRDTGCMHHPVKAFLAEELRSAHLPQWNPYMGLGVPLPGTAVDAVQHPFNLLLAALPFEAAFKSWLLLCYLVGGAGVFAWARRLELSFAPALGSSLAFALSGFLVSSSDNLTYLTVAASLPWLLAAFEAYLVAGGPLRLAGVCGASWFCAAAGDPQAWGLALGVLLVRGLVPAFAARLREPLRRTGLGVTVAAAGAAPIFLPVILWIPATRRIAAGVDATSRGRWDLHPLRVLELVLPSLFESGNGRMHGGVFQTFAGNSVTSLPWVASIYVGVACVALAALAVGRSPAVRLLIAGSAAFTWAACGHYLGFSAVAARVPLLGLFRYWEKLTVWPTLFLAVAAGFGLERLLGDRPPARTFALATGAAAALLLLSAGALRLFPEALLSSLSHPGVGTADATTLLENARRATFTAGVVLLLLALASLALSRGTLARAAPLVLVGILTLDAASANVRAYTLAPPEIVRTTVPLGSWLQAQGELARVLTPFELARGRWKERGDFESTWRWGAATLAPAWHVGARVSNLTVYTALSPARLDQIRLDAGTERIALQAGLWGVQYAVVPFSPALANRIGLRPPFDVAAVDGELPAFLVRLPHRPRTYLADEVVSTDAEGARAFALQPAAAESSRTVIEAPLPPDVPAGPPGSARITRESTDRVEIEVRAARPALLVLNDQDAPGWRADVDGQRRPIVTANYLARGVWVGMGTHRVVFDYRPPGLLAGWLVLGTAAAALGLWGLGLGVDRRRRARAVNSDAARPADA